MIDFLPHWVLTALVGLIAILFVEKGRERQDLLCMGLATLFVAIWMVAVTMTDVTVQRAHEIPLFWLALSIDALLPALFFVHLSILVLDQRYNGVAVRLHQWLPLALSLAVAAILHGFDPELFFRRVRLEAPAPGQLYLNPLYALKFSLGYGYFIFLTAAAFVMFHAVTRFQRVVDSMRLPEANRRVRALLSMGVLSAFWVAAFDVMPTLFSTSAPSLLRLIGPALGVAGAAYAMVLTGVLEPRSILRNGLFYSIRILVIAVPAMVILARYRTSLTELSPRWAWFVSLGVVVVIDFLVLRLKPLLDWLASPKAAASKNKGPISRKELDALVARHFTRSAQGESKPFSVGLLRLAPTGSGVHDTDKDLQPKILAAALERLRPTLETHEIAARYDDRTIALFLPRTDEHGLASAMRRLQAPLAESEISIEGRTLQPRFLVSLVASTHAASTTELYGTAEEGLEKQTPISNH